MKPSTHGLLKSNEVSLANTKVATKKIRTASVSKRKYPNLKISGQYQHLTKAHQFKLNNNGTSPQETPVVDQLILGQANATLPVFAGFKIKTVLLHLIISKRKQQMLCKPKKK
jgi:hypothetical protein